MNSDVQDRPLLPQRKLGSTGRAVSAVGFGAWAIGADWGEVDEAQAKAALHAGLDEGMTLIDTADIYGAGRSERIIGSVLAERGGERPFVATKLGRAAGFGPTHACVEATIRGSLERLRCEALDLVQVHCLPLELLRQSPLLEILEDCRERGLVRAWGVSIERLEEGRWLIENTPVAALQVIFNVLRQSAAEHLLPLAEEAGVGILARVPLASGLLTGKFSADHRFAESDHRHYNADGAAFHVGETFAGLPFSRGVELAGDFAGLVERELRGASLAQKALRWVLDHDAVSSVIPGAKDARQAHANAAAALMEPMSEEAHIRLREWYEDEVRESIRGEL